MRKHRVMGLSIMHRAVRALCAALLLSMAQAGAAHAETVEIVIEHLEMRQDEIRLAIGDTALFSNRSDISHNLYLTFEDGTVETLNTQPPGTRKSSVMNKAGQVIVRCWIHPIIHMELAVSDKK